MPSKNLSKFIKINLMNKENLIDFYGNMMINMAKDLYPSEFFFAIPDDDEGIHKLTSKCLNNDDNINNNYSNLQKRSIILKKKFL